MNNKKIFGLIILLLILISSSFLIGRQYERYRHTCIFPDTINSRVEQIIIKNDSILKVNDSINLRFIEIERTYEKTVDDIIRNNPRDDYNFFSTYIERYCGHNNSDTAQNSKFNIR